MIDSRQCSIIFKYFLTPHKVRTEFGNFSREISPVIAGNMLRNARMNTSSINKYGKKKLHLIDEGTSRRRLLRLPILLVKHLHRDRWTKNSGNETLRIDSPRKPATIHLLIDRSSRWQSVGVKHIHSTVRTPAGYIMISFLHKSYRRIDPTVTHKD